MDQQLRGMRDGLAALRRLQVTPDRTATRLSPDELEALHQSNEQQLAVLLAQIQTLADQLRPGLEAAAGAADARTDGAGDERWLDDGGGSTPLREVAELDELNDLERSVRQEIRRRDEHQALVPRDPGEV